MSLVKRNIKIFYRDKTAVFFSFLSVIILLSLYILFLGKSFGDGITFLNPKLVSFLVTSQLMGGVLVINTLTLSLGVVGSFVTDMDLKRLDAFLVAPVKRYKIILSYYLAAVTVTLGFSLVMWFLTVIYVYIDSGYLYNLDTIVKVILLLTFYTFISSSFMIFITSFIKSVNAFGTLGGVLGTLIGFATGIYIPLASLGETVKKVASIIPFTHMTILLKQVMLSGPYDVLVNLQIADVDMIEAKKQIAVYYGTNEVGLFGLDISLFVLMILSSVLAVLLLAYTTYRINKRMGR